MAEEEKQEEKQDEEITYQTVFDYPLRDSINDKVSAHDLSIHAFDGGGEKENPVMDGDIHIFQQSFLGLSIMDFSTNLGFNSDASSLSVNLIQDDGNFLTPLTASGHRDAITEGYHPWNPGAVPKDLKSGTGTCGGGGVDSDRAESTDNGKCAPITEEGDSGECAGFVDKISCEEGFNCTWGFEYDAGHELGMMYSRKGDIECFPQPGSPVFFKYYDGKNLKDQKCVTERNCENVFAFNGILSKWEKQYSTSGFTYSVNITDPREILENTVIILDNFSGRVAPADSYNIKGVGVEGEEDPNTAETSEGEAEEDETTTTKKPKVARTFEAGWNGYYNIVNVFGYYEAHGFGVSDRSDLGMKWFDTRVQFGSQYLGQTEEEAETGKVETPNNHYFGILPALRLMLSGRNDKYIKDQEPFGGPAYYGLDDRELEEFAPFTEGAIKDQEGETKESYSVHRYIIDLDELVGLSIKGGYLSHWKKPENAENKSKEDGGDESSGNDTNEYIIPNNYHISGDRISLLQLVQQVCDTAGVDFQVKLLSPKEAETSEKYPALWGPTKEDDIKHYSGVIKVIPILFSETAKKQREEEAKSKEHVIRQAIDDSQAVPAKGPFSFRGQSELVSASMGREFVDPITGQVIMGAPRTRVIGVTPIGDRKTRREMWFNTQTQKYQDPTNVEETENGDCADKDGAVVSAENEQQCVDVIADGGVCDNPPCVWTADKENKGNAPVEGRDEILREFLPSIELDGVTLRNQSIPEDSFEDRASYTWNPYGVEGKKELMAKRLPMLQEDEPEEYTISEDFKKNLPPVSNDDYLPWHWPEDYSGKTNQEADPYQFNRINSKYQDEGGVCNCESEEPAEGEEPEECKGKFCDKEATSGYCVGDDGHKMDVADQAGCEGPPFEGTWKEAGPIQSQEICDDEGGEWGSGDDNQSGCESVEGNTFEKNVDHKDSGYLDLFPCWGFHEKLFTPRYEEKIAAYDDIIDIKQQGKPIKGFFWDDDPYRDFHPIDGIFGTMEFFNPGLGKCIIESHPNDSSLNGGEIPEFENRRFVCECDPCDAHDDNKEPINECGEAWYELGSGGTMPSGDPDNGECVAANEEGDTGECGGFVDQASCSDQSSCTWKDKGMSWDDLLNSEFHAKWVPYCIKNTFCRSADGEDIDEIHGGEKDDEGGGGGKGNNLHKTDYGCTQGCFPADSQGMCRQTVEGVGVCEGMEDQGSCERDKGDDGVNICTWHSEPTPNVDSRAIVAYYTEDVGEKEKGDPAVAAHGEFMGNQDNEKIKFIEGPDECVESGLNRGVDRRDYIRVAAPINAKGEQAEEGKGNSFESIGGVYDPRCKAISFRFPWDDCCEAVNDIKGKNGQLKYPKGSCTESKLPEDCESTYGNKPDANSQSGECYDDEGQIHDYPDEASCVADGKNWVIATSASGKADAVWRYKDHFPPDKTEPAAGDSEEGGEGEETEVSLGYALRDGYTCQEIPREMVPSPGYVNVRFKTTGTCTETTTTEGEDGETKEEEEIKPASGDDDLQTVEQACYCEEEGAPPPSSSENEEGEEVTITKEMSYGGQIPLHPRTATIPVDLSMIGFKGGPTAETNGPNDEFKGFYYATVTELRHAAVSKDSWLQYIREIQPFLACKMFFDNPTDISRWKDLCATARPLKIKGGKSNAHIHAITSLANRGAERNQDPLSQAQIDQSGRVNEKMALAAQGHVCGDDPKNARMTNAEETRMQVDIAYKKIAELATQFYGRKYLVPLPFNPPTSVHCTHPDFSEKAECEKAGYDWGAHGLISSWFRAFGVGTCVDTEGKEVTEIADRFKCQEKKHIWIEPVTEKNKWEIVSSAWPGGDISVNFNRNADGENTGYPQNMNFWTDDGNLKSFVIFPEKDYRRFAGSAGPSEALNFSGWDAEATHIDKNNAGVDGNWGSKIYATSDIDPKTYWLPVRADWEIQNERQYYKFRAGDAGLGHLPPSEEIEDDEGNTEDKTLFAEIGPDKVLGGSCKKTTPSEEEGGEDVEEEVAASSQEECTEQEGTWTEDEEDIVFDLKERLNQRPVYIAEKAEFECAFMAGTIDNVCTKDGKLVEKDGSQIKSEDDCEDDWGAPSEENCNELSGDDSENGWRKKEKKRIEYAAYKPYALITLPSQAYYGNIDRSLKFHDALGGVRQDMCIPLVSGRGKNALMSAWMQALAAENVVFQQLVGISSNSKAIPTVGPDTGRTDFIAAAYKPWHAAVPQQSTAYRWGPWSMFQTKHYGKPDLQVDEQLHPAAFNGETAMSDIAMSRLTATMTKSQTHLETGSVTLAGFGHMDRGYCDMSGAPTGTCSVGNSDTQEPITDEFECVAADGEWTENETDEKEKPTPREPRICEEKGGFWMTIGQNYLKEHTSGPGIGDRFLGIGPHITGMTVGIGTAGVNVTYTLSTQRKFGQLEKLQEDRLKQTQQDILKARAKAEQDIQRIKRGIDTYRK